MSKSINISNSVIRRLPRYYRFLGELEDQQISKISSRELSERMHLTASQIRQDLNCFGGFGQQGYGYNVSELRKEIGRILGVDKHRKTILIGAGNLGTALAVHINFEKSGCSLIGIFDSNKKIVGNPLGKLTITDIDDLEKFCRENKPEVAVSVVKSHLLKKFIDVPDLDDIHYAASVRGQFRVLTCKKRVNEGLCPQRGPYAVSAGR